MTPAPPSELTAAARRALADHRLHGLTVPNRSQFPAGYLWDTAMIAKGLAVHDPELAAQDILRFLQAQWSSGMLPNEVYFERARGREVFLGRQHGAPRGITTSGITQPPLIVRSALEVGRRLPPERRRAFHEAVFPALLRLCQWAIDTRVGRRGLAVVIHPYETGMDNRIDLAEAMTAHWLAAGGTLTELARRSLLLALDAVRRGWGDLRTVSLEHRSSHRDVLAAQLQRRHIQRLGYDLTAIEASGRGVLIEDPCFNAVLIDALSCLDEIADELPATALAGTGLPGTALAGLRSAGRRLATQLDDLWQPAADGRPGHYASRDYRTGRLSSRPTVAGLCALLVDRGAERTRDLVRTLTDPSAYWTLVPPPSAPIGSDGFDPEQYWRGAAWSFPTDIIETGLELRGEHDVAQALRRAYLARPHGIEFAEYENPLTGAPLGARPFTPAAALTLRFADREGV